ncbi:putative serine/threonine-protein kinase-like protein CCR3 [Hibiscus syriacus]|uniref:non-specific serine/threonine protein kinase n=1 Tax=Hibiscus syriacus TaxID=106335 RepID=A0A6A2XWH5_HIBSY|nr:putative serine/threonine-protein kinase-like protein CCR3 [Hibiscus syriacus]
MGFFFCKFNLFPLFIFSYLCFACCSSSLSTVSISETSNLTIVCALVPTNGGLQPSSLNCSSFPVPGIRTPFNLNDSFSGIVFGDGFVCGLRPLLSPSNVSVMHCWRFYSNGSLLKLKRIYKGPVLNQLEAGNTRICGLTVGEGFVCGLTEDQKAIRFIGNFNGITGQEIRGNYKKIAAGFKHVCAINSDDGLECWGNTMGDRDQPQGQFKELALGLNRSCALRTNGTVVCWGMDSFRLPRKLETLDFITIKAKTNVFCGVSTTNYSLFCWGDRNFDSNPMVFSEVFPGPCRNVCRCGSLPGSGLLCRNGWSICQACPVADIPSAPSPQPENRSSNSDIAKIEGVVSMIQVGWMRPVPLPMMVRVRIELLSPPAVLEKRLSQLTSMGTTGRLEEFSFEALVQATNNFSDDHKIGTGSFGSVYHGTLDDGREVAIKRAEITSVSSYAVGTRLQEDKDDAFVNELEYLSRVHHKNLVQLLGFCEDSNERILIYEYMNNGTLHDHLHKFENSLSMSWAIRLKIASDTARGIQYLHEYAVPQIIHRDIKSANILLDTNWTAKVSDFGLSLMGPGDDESHLSLRAAGTVGYMDPEYYRLQQLTTKSDVYSFGVVLLELLSGYRAIHRNENGAHRNVVDFVVPYVLREEIHRVLDPRVPPPTPFEIEAVAYVGYLAADCVRLEGRDRPSTTEIVNSLEKALTACLIPHDFSRSTTQSSTEHTNFVQ